MDMNLTHEPEKVQMSTLDAFPNLEGHRGTIAFDVEHLGLGREAKPIGIAIATGDSSWYLPWGHIEGHQHTQEGVVSWCKDNLAGADVAFRNAKNDIEQVRKIGLDLEAIGIIPHEIQHAAALLDEHRRKFTLDALAQDRLGMRKMNLTWKGRDVPPAEIPLLPSWAVAHYAKMDARLTWLLDENYRNDIEKEELGDVLELEDSLLWCVLDMERQMVPIDVPKLDRWILELQEEWSHRVMEIYRKTGLRVNPDSPDDVAKLFNYMGLGFSRTMEGNPSFTGDFLKSLDDIPLVQLIIEARDMSSLRSKYLLKYRAALVNGMLPYQLHQLRADDGGTITGRFASSKVNIQQVFKPNKQILASPCTAKWLIRELFIPGQGSSYLQRFTVHDEVNGDLNGKWFHADASQIEYRLFAHFSCVPRPYSHRIIDAYNRDPNLSYHKWVHKEVLKGALIYDHAKNFNFMKLYGGGVDRAAEMLGTNDFKGVQEKLDIYDRELPEAKRLLYFVSELVERRGYCKTILGRRRRYAKGDRFYSGLNSVLQGSAADLMKLKLRRLYRERKNLDMLKKLEECFAVQEFPLRVPITWELSTGKNWRECS
jgi:DNA polymerase I-like protein with 3'-5' exonuclease and polymerase domains